MPNKPYDRKLRGRRCQCQGCFEYFNSTTAFDRHRVGNWMNRGENRRCLTVEEMREKGFTLNKSNFWITRSGPELQKLRSTTCT
jgi:hypothetical protein